jgi:hypothetical protein
MMPITSITRLRIRHWRYLPAFALHTLRSRRQIVRSKGFLGGYLGGGPEMAAWTVTVWQDLESMREYRKTGSHLKAMPKLLDWCDEASVATILDSQSTPLSPEEASLLLSAQGRISKVRNPSPAHASGEICPDRTWPRVATMLVPHGQRGG